MLLFTATFGGLLLMMGTQSRAEALFYYFRLEEIVETIYCWIVDWESLG